MLFLKEIEDLKDDGFEGSNDERRIFMDVFRGNEKGYTSKRCLVTGAINFEADSKHKNKLLHTDCENSPLTSQFSTKSLFVDESTNASEDARHLKDYPCQISRRIGESGCLQDTSASSVGLNSHDVNAKQMKGLFDELSVARDRISTESSPDVGSKTQIETRKEVASCISSHGSHCVGQIMTCQLVESSGQGVISSCYLLKQLHVDHGGDIDVPGASKCEVTTVLGRDCPYQVGRRIGESGCIQDSSASSIGLNAHGVNVKLMNGSFNELSVVRDKISTEHLSEEGNKTQIQTGNKVASCISSPNSHCAGQKMTCQLVEPSGKGVTSSCLLKQHVDYGDDIVPGASMCEVSTVLGKDGTRVIETMPSPVSHESFITKISIADSSITARERSPTSEIDIVPQKIDSVKDLRPCLRYHVNNLLKAAGWGLSTRIRKDRNVLAPVYVSPEGERVRAFQKAWWSCGERFQADRYSLMQENHEKQWIGINEFWSDLSDTLMKIGKVAHQTETCASLACLWNTLDPFVIVVYISKKIGALRGGKVIKATRSALFISSNNVDTVSNEVVEGQAINRVHNLPHESPPALGGAEIVTWGKDTVSAQSSNKDFSVHAEQNQGRAVKTLKGGSIYLTDAEGMVVGKSTGKGIRGQHFVTFGHQTDSLHPSSSPIGVSDFSCNHSDCQLYDVPITLGNIDTVLGKAGNVFCLQERNLNVTSSNEESSGQKVGREIATEGLSDECGMKKGTTLDKIRKKNLQGCLPDQLDHSISHCDSDNLAVQVDTCMHSAPLCSEFVEAVVERVPYNCNQKDDHESLPVLNQPSSVIENFELRSSQLSELSAVERQNLFLNPWGMFCHGALVHREGKGHSQENMLETADGRSMHHENLSFVYRCPGGEVHCLDEVEKEKSNLDFSCQEPYLFQRKVPTEGLQLSRHLAEESSKVVETTEVEMEHASVAETDVDALKKAPKKSKKISEIKSCIHHRELSLSTPEKVNSQNGQRLRTRSQFGESHKCQKGEASTDEGQKKSLFISSSQHQGAKKYRAKKLLHQCNDSQKIAVVTHGKRGRKKLHLDNSTSADTLPMKTGSEDSQYSSKISKTRKSEFKDKNGRKRSRRCQIEDDDLLIAAIIKPKDFGSKQSSTGRKHYNSKSLRKFKSQSNSCKLLPRSPGKGGKHMDGKQLSMGKRTVLSWLIDAGVVSVNDVVQYRRQKDDAVVKDGWITRDGIRCKCCDKVLSVSEFKVHAGFKLYRPCLNLFMESGTPFTLCQLQAWSAEYKARKGGMRATQVDEVDQNDDTCGLCGDGGELICCDNCPSTFHQACFSAQELPEGSWYCPYCTCRICGSVVSDTEASSSFVVLKCSQCEHKYHSSCVQESDMHKEDIVSGTWFCGENCKEVYTGLRSRVGILNHVADDFSWTLLKCIDGDQKIRSVQKCALMAECNSKLAVALRLMEECFLPMVDPRTGIDMIPHALYNWGSNFARLNYEGFYTVVLEKGDELVSVASIRVHGVEVAELPLIATCSAYRRQGMCRRLLNAIEEMLESFKVEKLVLAAIPNLVDTWTVGFGFEPLEDRDRTQLNKINLMVFPGATLLKKSLRETKATDIKSTGLGDASSLSRMEGSTGRGVESAGASDRNWNVTLVGPEVTRNLKPDEDHGSSLQRCQPRPSEKPIPMLKERETLTIPNVECCRAEEDTVGLYDGSRPLSIEQS